MGHANYYMLIDNAHTFLSGHSLVHLLTPKCLFHLRQDAYVLQILNALLWILGGLRDIVYHIFTN